MELEGILKKKGREMVGQHFPKCKTQNFLEKANAFTLKPKCAPVTKQAQTMKISPGVNTVFSVRIENGEIRHHRC